MAEESELKRTVNTSRTAETTGHNLSAHNGFVDDIKIEVVKFEPCDEHPLDEMSQLFDPGVLQQDLAISKAVVPSITTDEIEIGEVKIQPLDESDDSNHICDNWRDTEFEKPVVSANNMPLDENESSYGVEQKALLHAEISSPSSVVDHSLVLGQVKNDTNDLVLHLSSNHSLPDPLSLPVEMAIQKDSSIMPLVEETAKMRAPMEQPYACNQCDESFNSLTLLSNHLKIHRQLRCETCNKVFITEYYFTRHISKPYGCGSKTLCQAAKSRSRKLQPSMRIAKKSGKTNDECVAQGKVNSCKNTNMEEILFRCENCNKSFETKLSLEEHIELQHQSKQEEISQPNSEVNIRRASIGEKEHASEQPYDSKQIPPSILLKQPGETHAPDGSFFRCEICSHKLFKTKFGLDEHNALNHAIDEHALDGPPFRCAICNKSYKFKCTLRTHHALHHLSYGSEKSYTCNECNESFHNIVQLKVHRGSHMRIPCPQCKRMVNKRTLKYHLNTHAPDDKRFRCDLCGKLYSTNGGLKWHMTLKHAEDDAEEQKKSYVCEQCNKSFRHKPLWQQHRRCHIQQLCHICGKMMGITVIQMHIDNHLAEPLGGFKCGLCNKRYTQKSTLTQHIALIHRPADKNPQTQCFRCDQCDKPFTKRKQLRAHRRIHHFKKCPICEKDVGKPQFKSHMKKHEQLVNL